MRSHVVAPSECLSTIAAQYGFRDYRTIYDHPSNAPFKERRPNPNLIHPGDVINIPDLEGRTATVATGAMHRFTLRVATKPLVLRVRDAAGQPVANAEYLLVVEAVYFEGQTDGDGKIEVVIAPEARSGTLHVDDRVYRLAIGALNPMRQTPDAGVSGARGRLANLGYVNLGPAESINPDAIAVFQAIHGVKVTGELDAATLAKLEQEHGS